MSIDTSMYAIHLTPSRVAPYSSSYRMHTPPHSLSIPELMSLETSDEFKAAMADGKVNPNTVYEGKSLLETAVEKSRLHYFDTLLDLGADPFVPSTISDLSVYDLLINERIEGELSAAIGEKQQPSPNFSRINILLEEVAKALDIVGKILVNHGRSVKHANPCKEEGMSWMSESAYNCLKIAKEKLAAIENFAKVLKSAETVMEKVKEAETFTVAADLDSTTLLSDLIKA